MSSSAKAADGQRQCHRSCCAVYFLGKLYLDRQRRCWVSGL